MSAKTEQTDWERIIEALIFSFFTYILYVALYGALLPFEWTFSQQSPEHYNVHVERWRLLAIAAIAVVIGFAWGYIREHDLMLKHLRRWKLTRRSSNESVWTDVFLTASGAVQVGLGDGQSVIGWLKRYAEAGEERTLFLENARWIVEGDHSGTVSVESDEITSIPGLLLTEKAEIKYVMFLDKSQI